MLLGFFFHPELYQEQVQSAFFDLEVAMEKDKCRDLVCLDPEAEKRKSEESQNLKIWMGLRITTSHNSFCLVWLVIEIDCNEYSYNFQHIFQALGILWLRN